MSKHFTFEERLQLKRKLEENLPICQIAEELNKNKSTVYNELKRGKKDKHDTYDPYIAQSRYDTIQSINKPKSKLEKNRNLAEKIAGMILSAHLSPENISKKLNGSEYVSPGTIYSAIDAGLIPGVNREILRNGYGIKVYNRGTIIIPKYIIQKASIQDGDVLSVELQDNNTILLQKISSPEKK